MLFVSNPAFFKISTHSKGHLNTIFHPTHFYKDVSALLTLFWTFGNSGQANVLADLPRVTTEQKAAMDHAPVSFSSPNLSIIPF